MVTASCRHWGGEPNAACGSTARRVNSSGIARHRRGWQRLMPRVIHAREPSWSIASDHFGSQRLGRRGRTSGGRWHGLVLGRRRVIGVVCALRTDLHLSRFQAKLEATLPLHHGFMPSPLAQVSELRGSSLQAILAPRQSSLRGPSDSVCFLLTPPQRWVKDVLRPGIDLAMVEKVKRRSWAPACAGWSRTGGTGPGSGGRPATGARTGT
jgi:hypothetical protein